MKTYELTYIISPELTSDQIESKEKEVVSAIQTREGVIIKQAKPMAKTLAYPIGKYSSGFFGTMEFQLEEEKLPEVTAMLSIDGKIVRNMVIIKEPHKIKKQRRTRRAEEMPSILSEKKVEKKAEAETEEKAEKIEKAKTPAFEDKEEAVEDKKETEPKGKVELKDIEQELEDILGE